MKKTLEEILVTYQKKKEKKEKENELIKKELYRKYPEFDEIERKIAKLYLQKSIKNLTIKKQNIDKEIKKLEEKKEKYIKDKKIKISDFEPKYDCKKCKDTGYIIENGLRKKCDCLVQEIININYNISNLKSDGENILEKFSFDYYSEEKKENEKNSPRELAKKAYDGAKEFIKNFGKTKNNIKNIIYIGETGLR